MRLQGPLARLVVLSDYEELLARCPVVSTWKVVESVISRVESIDDREVHRASGLYDAPAHGAEVVIDRLVVKLWERALCTKQNTAATAAQKSGLSARGTSESLLL